MPRNPVKSSVGTAAKAQKDQQSGFESLRPHSKTLAKQGFSRIKTQSGQNPGQITLDMVPYKLAKVYNGDNEWFVEYSFWSLSKKKYKRKKVRLGQKGLTKEDRQGLLEELRDELNVQLRTRNKNKIYHNEASTKKKHRDLPLVESLRLVEPSDAVPEDRITSYRGLASKLEEFYVQHPAFAGAYPDEVDEVLVSAYKSFIQKDGFSTKTINKHLWALQNACKLFGEDIETTSQRVKLIRNETRKYPPLTDEEKEIAFSYFRKHIPWLHLMHFCQYYTCIRPAELHRLQIRMFDFKRKTVFIDWLDTKNGLSAHVQLLDPLVKLMLEYGVDKLPGDFYLFGKKCEPSAERYEGDWAGDTWGNHRQRMGMPKNKQSYGLKHTFNRDYVENNKGNIDWEFLRRHNRHATIQQTQQYISELTAYFLDQERSVILDYTQKEIGTSQPSAEKSAG